MACRALEVLGSSQTEGVSGTSLSTNMSIRHFLKQRDLQSERKMLSPNNVFKWYPVIVSTSYQTCFQLVDDFVYQWNSG